MMPAQQTDLMVSVQALLHGIVDIDTEQLVSMMTLDARTVQAEGLFFAVSGSRAHGLQYAEQAIKNGVAVIIYDPTSGGELLAKRYRNRHDLMLLALENLADHIGELAARFYHHPSTKLAVLGVTGTNGKTSVSHFLAQALESRTQCAVIGTLGWGYLERLNTTANTTPDAITIQRQLASFVNDGVDAVAIEVSSHGLQQGRVSCVQFEGAVFTNLTHDHLDYHGSMAAYGDAKLELFRVPGLKFAVLNLDDAFSATILKVLDESVHVVGFSRATHVDVNVDVFLSVQHVSQDAHGVSFELSHSTQSVSIHSSILGDFNVDNIVATLATLLAMDWPMNEAAASVKNIKSIAGRMECIAPSPDLPLVIVDYAHTPDALASVLTTLREHCAGSLRVVFGCGGDRDQDKRAQMGRLAGELADAVIITNDNPRSENAERIADQVLQGVEDQAKAVFILDRKAAIEKTIEHASVSDVVVIAGKGHEDYQLIAEERLSFSDANVARQALKAYSAKEIH